MTILMSRTMMGSTMMGSTTEGNQSCSVIPNRSSHDCGGSFVFSAADTPGVWIGWSEDWQE
jgi:hypothetical protein